MQNTPPQMIKTMLVPIDFCAPSRAALEFALGLARIYGSRVDALYVWPPPNLVRVDQALYGSPADGVSMVEYARTRATVEFDRFIANIDRAENVTLALRVTVGVPDAKIIEIARVEKYDLIVITSGGAHGASSPNLGNVVAKVLHHAPCPVLTIPVCDGDQPQV